MCGWGLVIATIIVLSNLAGVATSYFWLLAGELSSSVPVAALADSLFSTGSVLALTGGRATS